MNFGTLFIGFLLALIIFSPIIMSVYGERKRKNKLRSAINEKIHSMNLQPGLIDFAGNIAIALDKEQSRLFFVNLDNLEWVQDIETQKLLSCKKLHEYRSYRTAYGMQQMSSKIDLQFKLKNGNGNSVYFSIFDEEQGSQLSGELDLAKKWEQIISELIEPNQQLLPNYRNIKRRA